MLSFGTTRSGVVRVRLFDSGGRLVRTVLDTALPAGQHEVPLEAKNAIGSPLASGVYFFRVEAPGDVMTGRFVVAK
jgi:flagellar hook assembly protein FlgD